MSASYVFSPSGHMTARYRLLYPSMEGLKMKWMARRERGGGGGGPALTRSLRRCSEAGGSVVLT